MQPLYPWLITDYQKITHAFQRGLGHHALLFKGDTGLGIEELIFHISGFLLCQSHEVHPCGHCHQCRLYQANNHPDFYHLAPIEDKDIGVDQVREVLEKLTQSAQQGGNKVVFIDGANRLTEAAANAILKNLEEPRPNTYFLIKSEQGLPLLPTIYSRCQPWLIASPSVMQSVAWLQTQLPNISEDILLPALRMSAYRPLSALNFVQENLLEQRTTLLRHFWLFYTRLSPLEILPSFDKAILFQQLDWIEAFVNDSLKCKLGIFSGWQCADIAKGIERFAANLSVDSLLGIQQILQKMRTDLREINAVNQELILLDGFTQLITKIFAPKLKEIE